MNTLNGYKTYILAGISILIAIGGFITGTSTLANTITLCLSAAMAAFLRDGVATSHAKLAADIQLAVSLAKDAAALAPQLAPGNAAVTNIAGKLGTLAAEVSQAVPAAPAGQA